ncbi:MAG TPA: substrate-binding domain-containing protein [Polyangiaceae bacterium]
MTSPTTAGGSSNCLRELRQARGLSQSALANAVKLSRQSVHAIETGRAVPAVDIALKLASVLDCSVEALFAGRLTEQALTTEAVGESFRGRVSLAHIADRWLSYAMSPVGLGRSADAVVSRATRGRVEVELLRTPAELRENVVVMGCAPALGLLADRLNAHAGPGRFLWLSRSSTSALEALGRGQTHLSGVHLVDAKTGEANVPDARSHSQQRALVLITLAVWEVGLVVAPGNPKRILQISDLGTPGVRLISRESGSGARRLLERELRRARLPIELAERAMQASGHLELAHAVSIGAGDVGIATRDAALAFGLSFVPLAEERYDLVLPRDELTDPRLARLFDVMTSGPFRRELSSLGYDLEQCGERVAEIPAA